MKFRRWRRIYWRYSVLKDEETDTESETNTETDTESETERETEREADELQTPVKIDVKLNEASRRDVMMFWMNAMGRKFRRRRYAVTQEEMKEDLFRLQVALTVEALWDHGMI